MTDTANIPAPSPSGKSILASTTPELDDLNWALWGAAGGPEPKPCVRCEAPNDVGDLCAKCAEGNDPFAVLDERDYWRAGDLADRD